MDDWPVRFVQAKGRPLAWAVVSAAMAAVLTDWLGLKLLQAVLLVVTVAAAVFLLAERLYWQDSWLRDLEPSFTKLNDAAKARTFLRMQSILLDSGTGRTDVSIAISASLQDWVSFLTAQQDCAGKKWVAVYFNSPDWWAHISGLLGTNREGLRTLGVPNTRFVPVADKDFLALKKRDIEYQRWCRSHLVADSHTDGVEVVCVPRSEAEEAARHIRGFAL